MAAGSKSRKYRLRDGHPLAKEIRRAASGRADHALEQLHEELAREPEEAVHTARKDLKKLRSLLRLVRPGLDDEVYARTNDDLRVAGRALGGIRDADVLLETLEELLEREDELTPAGGVGRLREDLLDQRARAHHGSGPNRAAAEASELIEGAASGIPDWPDAVADAVVPGLERAYRRGRNRMREAEDDPTTERLHEWRKRAKDHWYHLRLVRDAWPEPLKARADEVHSLTDLIGDDHDVALLVAEIETRLPEDSERAELLAAASRRRGELQGAAFDLGARVYAEKPKALRRRMEALLEAWQGAPLHV